MPEILYRPHVHEFGSRDTAINPPRTLSRCGCGQAAELLVGRYGGVHWYPISDRALARKLNRHA